MYRAKSISFCYHLSLKRSSVNHAYYFNPVYQSKDGSVYLISSDGGFMVNNEAYSEGSVFSQTLDATTTITENGKAKKDSISIKISINVMFATVKTIILQMDSDNVVISRTEYRPEEMPGDFALETATAYFIVETYKMENAETIIVRREIYGSDIERIETFFVREDGVCVKSWIQIYQ